MYTKPSHFNRKVSESILYIPGVLFFFWMSVACALLAPDFSRSRLLPSRSVPLRLLPRQSWPSRTIKMITDSDGNMLVYRWWTGGVRRESSPPPPNPVSFIWSGVRGGTLCGVPLKIQSNKCMKSLFPHFRYDMKSAVWISNVYETIAFLKEKCESRWWYSVCDVLRRVRGSCLTERSDVLLLLLKATAPRSGMSETKQKASIIKESPWSGGVQFWHPNRWPFFRRELATRTSRNSK